MNIGEEYDVIVCGGGPAGFCAAVQAGRAGMCTALVEKYGMSGGIMTVLGNNSVAQFSAYRKMIIEGIGWELLCRLESMGYAHIPDQAADFPKHWMYGVDVNPVAAAKLMDDFYLEAGVSLYYNQPAVDVVTQPDGDYTRITGVVIATKTGLTVLNGKIVIDCTGDGDVAAFAGAPYECGDEESGELQPGTIRYYLNRNRLSCEEKTAYQDMVRLAKSSELLKLGDLNTDDLSKLVKKGANNTNHVSNFNSADSKSKTNAEIESRRKILRVMEMLRQSGVEIEVTNCAPEVAPRESRRILGESYITVDDYVNARVYEDAICYSFYPIDLHLSGDNGIYQVFLEHNRVPTIPLSALMPKGLSNVYVAGRCASGDRLANSAYRVKASCMAMGQAAGAAATIAIEENNSLTRGVNLSHIKEILKDNQAIVPSQEHR